ncbi:hypothetical protein LP420_32165 [Massilia sp. B-10]|nr:hypothetical protein LP420_32165 [Massilia sp. B-10]
MAEAEDVITDAARHATIFARLVATPSAQGKGPLPLQLADIMPTASTCSPVRSSAAVSRCAWPNRQRRQPG